MKQFDFKKILPHLIAIAIFLIVAVVYCKPALQGKVVQQHDTQGWRGMSQQSMEFHEKYGYYPLWTNSMFSGMPAYQIAFDPRTKITVGYLHYVFTLGLPKPINFFFLACICFYFLCLVAGANPWVAILGALAYSYSTFNAIIIGVGHDTQMLSLGYAPAVIAGLLLLFQKKYWLGFAVTALFSSLLIAQGHLQIVYYTLLISACVSVVLFIIGFKNKTSIAVLKSAGLGLTAALLGLATNAVSMMPTYEYAKESIRGGKSELVDSSENGIKTKGGLDKDYAFAYSVGIGETLTMMVPAIYGGSNGGREHGADSKFAEKLTEVGFPEESAIQTANGYSYWGLQQPTSGPVYMGAVICFLFIFGMFYLKTPHKWWILAATLLGIFMAWGSNLKAFNYFLFDYLPFYNKFRAPSMGMVMPQFCMPLLAVLTVTQLLNLRADTEYLKKKFKISVIITGAILAIAAMFYFTAGFSGPQDKNLKENFKQNVLQQVPAGQQASPQLTQQAEEFSSGLLSALHEDRKNAMGSDLIRSLIFIALAALLIWLYSRQKIKPAILISLIILLATVDLLMVDTRYLNSDNYVDDTDFESVFIPTAADKQILNDPDHANFRVFNSSASDGPFNDSRTSYHHNSVGGYHPAKLGLYQDLIERQLSKGNIEVFNMLNTKYFITPSSAQGGEPIAQLNPNAFGNVWFVRSIKYVKNANEEMAALDNTNLRDTAIVEESFKDQLKQPIVFDSSASIKLKENINDKVSYTSNSPTPQFAVFSEVYYNKGWNAFVDGKPSAYAKVNYVLRGMFLPAGKHDIEFRFEPKSYTTGRMISIWSNILVILTLIVTGYFYVKQKRQTA